jgi:hypothetical protein
MRLRGRFRDLRRISTRINQSKNGKISPPGPLGVDRHQFPLPPLDRGVRTRTPTGQQAIDGRSVQELQDCRIVPAFDRLSNRCVGRQGLRDVRRSTSSGPPVQRAGIQASGVALQREAGRQTTQVVRIRIPMLSLFGLPRSIIFYFAAGCEQVLQADITGTSVRTARDPSAQRHTLGRSRGQRRIDTAVPVRRSATSKKRRSGP